MNTVDELVAVALLAEPVRRGLYDYVRDGADAVGRDEAARATGISRKLAAFHLDRLADAGLLEVEFRRLSGRTGPGAGRPAKLYRVSAHRFSVALPRTGYALAATIMATALARTRSGEDGHVAAHHVARDVGERLGEGIRGEHRGRGARRDAVDRTLADLGFGPRRASGEVVLSNCIFAELAEAHRDLVCGMNLALVSGLLAGARLSGHAAVPGDTGGGTCCVRVSTT